MAAIVKILPGSIGYFELSYAGVEPVAVRRHRGPNGRLRPTVPGERRRGRSHEGNLTASNFSIVNEPGPQSYPISGYSWLLIYMRQSSAASGAALVQLVDWMTHAGQAIAEANDYVPLPSDVQALRVRPFSRSWGHRASDCSDEVAYRTDHLVLSQQPPRVRRFVVMGWARPFSAHSSAPRSIERGAWAAGRLGPPNWLAWDVSRGRSAKVGQVGDDVGAGLEPIGSGLLSSYRASERFGFAGGSPLVRNAWPWICDAWRRYEASGSG